MVYHAPVGLVELFGGATVVAAIAVGVDYAMLPFLHLSSM
jgi:hypothetical protein